MSTRLALLAIFACLLLVFEMIGGTALVASAAPEQHQYTIVDLGTLPGGPPTGVSQARFINNRGQVVGDGYCCTGTQRFATRAFIWQPTTGIHVLGTLDGFENTTPTGLNNQGQVIGYGWNYLNSSVTGGFITSAAGDVQDLGSLGGSFTEPSAINDRAQVVGVSATNLFVEHAFLWQPGRGMQDLGTLASSAQAASAAKAIDARGDVAGWSQTASGVSHAFLWRPRSGMLDLDPGNPRGSVAQFINNRGQVSGTLTLSTGQVEAFLWDDDTGLQAIPEMTRVARMNARGDLVGSGPTGGILWQPDEGVTSLGVSVSPNGINDRVEVVGELQAGGGTTHAFVWQARRGVQDLGVLPGMTNSTAFAINPRGQIVGASFNPSQPGFPLHAVLWNPS